MTDLMDVTSDASDVLVEEPAPQLHVCPYEKDGKICGVDFDSKVKLNAHTMAVHQRTWDGKVVNRPGRKAKGAEEPPSKAKAEPKAAKQATKPVSPIVNDSNRTAVYTKSLATMGLLAHLAAGRYFTDADLNVWSNGAPGLAGALDAVGEQNEGLRRTCDLLLAGGTGGAYVQLILASAMIAVPIAANHGLLPPEVGKRFGSMIGVFAQPEPEQFTSGAAPSDVTGRAAPAPPTNQLPISEWSMDEWREVLFAVPQNETAMGVMMEMVGPAMGGIGVSIPPMPGTEPMTIPEEGSRGSLGTDQGQEDSETGPVPAGQVVP